MSETELGEYAIKMAQQVKEKGWMHAMKEQ